MADAKGASRGRYRSRSQISINSVQRAVMDKDVPKARNMIGHLVSNIFETCCLPLMLYKAAVTFGYTPLPWYKGVPPWVFVMLHFFEKISI